jgi:hypothetical protein
MQYVHVKRKETRMNRYLMEEFYRTPGLRERLDRAAHRERARALHDGLVWLWSHTKTLLAPRLHARPSRWIERLG